MTDGELGIGLPLLWCGAALFGHVAVEWNWIFMLYMILVVSGCGWSI